MAEVNYEKQLKIKLGSLKRLNKEYLSYVKEAETQKAKIDQLKAENAEEYTIKKQNEVLEDAKQMIPNCKGRLEAAHDDLSSWLEDNGTEGSIQSQVPEAQELISTVKEFLESLNQTSSN